MHRNGQRQNERKAHYANSRVVRCMLLCNLFVLILRFCILSFQICGPHSENCANFQGNTIRMQGDTHRINPKTKRCRAKNRLRILVVDSCNAIPFFLGQSVDIGRQCEQIIIRFFAFHFSGFFSLCHRALVFQVRQSRLKINSTYSSCNLHGTRVASRLHYVYVFLSSRRDCFVRQSIAIPYLTSSSDLYNQLRLI